MPSLGTTATEAGGKRVDDGGHEAASAIGARRKAQHGISHACFELRWCIVAVAVPRRR